MRCLSDPWGNRTPVYAVRGRRLSRLTNRPCSAERCYYSISFPHAAHFALKTSHLRHTIWVQRDFYAGATISARLLRVYLRLSARPRILAGRRIAQARFEPEPCRRASGFAWPAVKSPLQPYGLSPPAKPRMPPEAARECAPAGLHE